MTDNMKKLMEKVSADEALKMKADELGKQAKGDAEKAKELMKTFAAELDIALTDEDFKADDAELSEDELEAVAGGATCVCVVGGGGSGDEYSCVCAVCGMGGPDRNYTCWCFAGGTGTVH